MTIKWNKWLYLSLLACSITFTTEVVANENQEQELSINGQLIWADLYSANVDASINFYNNTFGWTTKVFGKKSGKYHIFYDGELPIAGLLARNAQRGKTEKALWIGSIAQNKISSTVEIASENNATIILKAHHFELYGERAVLADPSGGVIALLNIDKNKKNKISTKWNWAQLFSIDTEASANFYRDTFNFTLNEISENSETFFLLNNDNYLASIVKLPESFEQRNRWVNFLNVTDLNQIIEKAKSNGAEIIYAPKDNQDLAILADPNGALIGLIQTEIK